MTFSLAACDLDARQWGVAVASKFPSVGAFCPWARGDAGAVATQSFVNVMFGPDGLDRLESGEAAESVLEALLAADDQPDDRQVGIVDAHGGSATFTGPGCFGWAGGTAGPCYAAQGNVLAGPRVVDALVETFTSTTGSLAERLTAALLAGDRAGGDRRGRQSAAMIVRQAGGGYGGNNDILLDLRVDDHPDPVPELIRLLGIHTLLFGKTPPDEFLPLDGELGDEVRSLVERSGRGSLEEWAGYENLEERLWPDGSRIDPVVLRVLRETG
ncbi:MAG TPA: DUF1028 domain-containing protein [Gaiellales bacterium]|nr:DUF1028 domain-containing protein [Gaiellales bacterium]